MLDFFERSIDLNIFRFLSASVGFGGRVGSGLLVEVAVSVVSSSVDAAVDNVEDDVFDVEVGKEVDVAVGGGYVPFDGDGNPSSDDAMGGAVGAVNAVVGATVKEMSVSAALGNGRVDGSIGELMFKCRV